MKTHVLTLIAVVSLLSLSTARAEAATYTVSYDCPQWKSQEFEENNDPNRLLGEEALNFKKKMAGYGLATKIAYGRPENSGKAGFTQLMFGPANGITYKHVVSYRALKTHTRSYTDQKKAMKVRDYLRSKGVNAVMTTN